LSSLFSLKFYILSSLGILYFIPYSFNNLYYFLSYYYFFLIFFLYVIWIILKYFYYLHFLVIAHNDQLTLHIPKNIFHKIICWFFLIISFEFFQSKILNNKAKLKIFLSFLRNIKKTINKKIEKLQILSLNFLEILIGWKYTLFYYTPLYLLKIINYIQ